MGLGVPFSPLPSEGRCADPTGCRCPRRPGSSLCADRLETLRSTRSGRRNSRVSPPRGHTSQDLGFMQSSIHHTHLSLTLRSAATASLRAFSGHAVVPFLFRDFSPLRGTGKSGGKLTSSYQHLILVRRSYSAPLRRTLYVPAGIAQPAAFQHLDVVTGLHAGSSCGEGPAMSQGADVHGPSAGRMGAGRAGRFQLCGLGRRGQASHVPSRLRAMSPAPTVSRSGPVLTA